MKCIKKIIFVFFTRSRISEEYLRRVCAAVLADEDLAAIGRGIPRLLVEQIRAGVICQQERQESLIMPVYTMEHKLVSRPHLIAAIRNSCNPQLPLVPVS
jgi:hypothetical protein